jgi:ribose transport system substrate-binding protein
MQVRIRLAIGLALLTAIGCGGSSTGSSGGAPAAGTKRIILLNNGPSPFFNAARAGIKDAVKDLKLEEAGLTAVMEDNDGKPQGQLNWLRQFGSQSDIAGVGVSAIDADNVAIADEMRKLQDKGIKVITFDSDLNREKLGGSRYAFIGTDNFVGGKELGKCAAGLRPDGGEWVSFVGRTGAQNAIERVDGFAQGVGPKFKKLDNMGDENDRTRARDNVRNAIRNHPGLNTLVGIWSYNAPAIVDVVKDLNKRSQMTVVVFDAEPLAIQGMADGYIDALVVQNPYKMGYDGVRMLKALIKNEEAVLKEMLPKHGQPGGDIYDTGLKVVVPDTGSALKPEMFEKTTQFLKLGEFRQWLAKYNLTES